MVPVNLDWVLGLTLEPRGRRGLVVWGVGTELGAERGAEDMEVKDTELAMILWAGWFDSEPGRARATVCTEGTTFTSITI